MHDLRVFREHVDALRDGMRRRDKLDQYGASIDEGVALDARRRSVIQAVEEKKAARNQNSQEVARRKKAGEDATSLITNGRALGDEISALENELQAAESRLSELLLDLPNVTLEDVPAGGEEANRVVSTWGTPRPSDGVKPHWEIGEALGMLDLMRGAKVSGSGFVVFRGLGARLVRGLITWFVDTHVRDHGYEEIWPPVVVNRATMIGTGQLPKFEEDMYALRDDPLFLIPTAEVPVTNLYRDEILDASALPKGFVAYTPCFRREAGAAGKDTRGLLRLHEFDKVEVVRYCTPEQSPNEHERLTRHAETLLERLELPYRRVLLAAGDTGFGNAKTYDLEAWAPGVGKWLEVSSCSTYTDFQARRANIRYRPAPGEKPRFIHTLNGSALAFPRTIACLLENHQRPDGTVTVPEALRGVLGTDRLV
ncbi:MAG TPA: serine--tRNA ligase [Gemmatimonadaceae bacterium]|nr:serine--tRNA ligase [Gemmatimonadaceae bacterium]